jgi:hypothetical protein
VHMPKDTGRWHVATCITIVSLDVVFFSLWTVSTARATETLEPTQYISFSRNVTAALDKAGCNLGACHGNQRGKGGFQLSLRGEAPHEDFNSLLHGELGRRIDRLVPEQSLILLKGKGAIAHEGGTRFTESSPAYQALFAWLKAGAPAPSPEDVLPTNLQVLPEQTVFGAGESKVQLTVIANWPNGTSTDVTSMAIYEPLDPSIKVSANGLLEPTRRGTVGLIVRYLGVQKSLPLFFSSKDIASATTTLSASTWIDEPIVARLASIGAQSASQATDDVLVRRLYIDLAGRLPTATEAQAFVQSNQEDKYSELVDRLLASPEFVLYWTLKWSDVLRCDEKVLDPEGVKHFGDWLRQAVADAKPTDQFVRELLTSTGSTYSNPPTNFYRALRDPQTRGEAVARVFLGYRMQCAQCHNHPFDQWTQADYYSWASVFSGVDYEIKSNDRKDDLDKNEFRGEQVVLVKEVNLQKHPRNGQKMPPKVLEREANSLTNATDPRIDLANWLTANTNKQFARAQVNWIFFHLMGRGLVDPVDDFRSTNPPSHPELLDEMAQRWIDHQFDLRWMVREIVNSQTYKLSSTPSPETPEDEAFFGYRVVRRHAAEILADAQSDVLGVHLPFDQQPAGTRAIALRAGQREQRYLKSAGDAFLGAFGKPQRLTACECERSNDLSLSQVFQLMQGESVEKRIRDNKGRIRRLAERDDPLHDLVSELYWTALSRPPTEIELQQATDAITAAGSKRQGLEDLTWALLNSQEFLLHH